MTDAWPRFSLLFFASQPAEFRRGKFDLFRESTQFADRRGFEAVWIPERHFHAFGGMFPNPALAGVVLAETTERIRIRAGSVVMPLHHPIRVAEEWAVVDNLSDGRVDVSFAVGWNPNDFAIAPQAYTDRQQRTFQGIEIVRRLWRGDEIETENGLGQAIRVRIHPLPRQRNLTVWLTCSGGRERYIDAGTHGFNILTALLFQSVADLGEKIAAYREARVRHGHVGPGQVTLMLHTFVGSDEGAVRRAVREPFKRYLESSVDLWRVGEARLEDLPPRKRADLLEYAFERYYRKTALLGTLASCRHMVEAVRSVGVDEIACLVDFGVAPAEIMAGLDILDELRHTPRPASTG
ncbi:MAG: MupA/Atu3671 family FMN-dependent luciferase-like monooxygenase [Candidatus Rokuibacteriota bacterium]